MPEESCLHDAIQSMLQGCAMPAGSVYAAVGNTVYSRSLDVPNHLKREAKAKGFTNIEQDIQEAIHTAYGGTAKDK